MHYGIVENARFLTPEGDEACNLRLRSTSA